MARAWLAAHGITRIERIVTDNGACYRAESFSRALLGARRQRIAPYTPRHNGKVERYNRILAEEFLYARTWTSEAQRSQLLDSWDAGMSTTTTTDPTTRSEANHRQHYYQAASPTSWPLTASAEVKVAKAFVLGHDSVGFPLARCAVVAVSGDAVACRTRLGWQRRSCRRG